MLENSIDGYFDDIFYRYKHEEIREEMEELHRNFKELLQKIMMLYEQSDEKTGLYMDIQQKGGIISEQIPGQPPLPAYFPERNRIISGLADVVLVIEAKEKSGSSSR